jgi:hypothetical protein
MSTKRVFVLGLIAGGFYVAACGSTNSSVGDTGTAAGASGKPGSSGAAGANTAGASAAGASGDGTSGANTSGAGGAPGGSGGTGTSGASTGGTSGAGTSGSAGTSSAGAASGGSAGHAGGSGGGPDCAAVKCGGALTACGVNQPKIPPGQCCPTCACGGACITDVSCPTGTTAVTPTPDPNICCQQLVCVSTKCVGKACGASCGTGEVPSACDATGMCITGGAPVCPSK